MPDSPAKKKWLKDNSKAISFRLMLKGDADIIKFLEGVPTATTIKAALREYMKNHSSAAPSAAQPAEEEEDDDDWIEAYMNAISPNHPDNVKKNN